MPDRLARAHYFLLVATIVVLFPIYEIMAYVALNIATVDLYFAARVIIGAIGVSLVVLFLSRRYRKNLTNNREIPEAISPRVYLEALLTQEKRFRYARYHVIAWSGSALCLSYAFSRADFIVTAYIFFGLHPLWTYLLVKERGQNKLTPEHYSQRNGRLPAFFKSILVFVKDNTEDFVLLVMLLVGTVIFLIGERGLRVPPVSDSLSLLFGLIGGFCFAGTNVWGLRAKLSGETLSGKEGRTVTADRLEIYDAYLQFARYVVGLIFAWAFVAITMLDSWARDGKIQFLSVSDIGSVAVKKSQEFVAGVDVFWLSSFRPQVAAIILILAASSIAVIANYILFLLFKDKERVPLPAALETLTIPMAAGITWVLGLANEVSNLMVFMIGLATQVFAAARLSYLFEKRST